MTILFRIVLILPAYFILFNLGVFRNDDIIKVEDFPFYHKNFSELKHFIEEDSLKVLLCQVIDENCATQFFYSDVFAEVCETKMCKPVDLRIFWDFTGQFIGFSLHKGLPLTKLDHVNFSSADYFQLYQILNNPYSKLAQLDKALLVEQNNLGATNVDAVSSATQLSVYNVVVEGAAFSTYVLWNAVYSKAIQNNITKISENEMVVREYESMSVSEFTNCIDSIGYFTAAKTSVILNLANKKGWLKRRNVQVKLVESIFNCSELQAILINNYLLRQVYLYPEAETRLSGNVTTAAVFKRMISLQ